MVYASCYDFIVLFCCCVCQTVYKLYLISLYCILIMAPYLVYKFQMICLRGTTVIEWTPDRDIHTDRRTNMGKT
jgi:hypothetical protein